MEKCAKRKKITAKFSQPWQPSEADRVEGNREKMQFQSDSYVVSIDFGTTFSGVALGKQADFEFKNRKKRAPAPIAIHQNWPGQGQAGARPYCKTQTSIWYMPGRTPGTFDMKGWGWTGFASYKRCLQDEGFMAKTALKQFESTRHHNSVPNLARSVQVDKLHENCGYFLTRFKLGLAGERQNLPKGLSLERVISDYLRELSVYAVKELQKKYDSAIRSRNIQYVLTVPALWNDREQQTMQQCAEMAGIVGGPACENNASASPHDLIFLKEPEAAAFHVNGTLQTATFMNGDRFLVVDVGGGTTDTVLHEKVGLTTRRNMKVREVSATQGNLVGGSHVDDNFFTFLRQSIGCFSDFEFHYPHLVLEIIRWWSDMKCSFDDDHNNDFRMPIPGKLAKAWRRFDLNSPGRVHRREGYDLLWINNSDLKKCFDPVVKATLDLIRRQLVSNLRAILVVGGFSESPYLRRRIEDAFHNKAKSIVFADDAGSAVLRGAASIVLSKEWNTVVSARISKYTYGYDTAKPFVSGKHRQDYLVCERGCDKIMCDNIFGVIIKRDADVPVNYLFKTTLQPLYRENTMDGDNIELNLYCTKAKNPRYVTEKGVKKIGSCIIPVPRKDCVGKKPKLELTAHFSSLLRLSVKGKNFFGDKVTMNPVVIKWAPLSAP